MAHTVLPVMLHSVQSALPILGPSWMDPNYLLAQYGTALIWVSLAIIFIECGLLFPILPGDSLLFAIGLFIADRQAADQPLARPDPACSPPRSGQRRRLRDRPRNRSGDHRHDGRIIKRKYLDQTHDFFEKHGDKALVIGRFVPIVRTFVTVVAGIGRMDRRRFLIWSAVGAALWVCSVTLPATSSAGFPVIQDKLDTAILLVVLVSLIPAAVEWWRHRRDRKPSATELEQGAPTPEELETGSRDQSQASGLAARASSESVPDTGEGGPGQVRPGRVEGQAEGMRLGLLREPPQHPAWLVTGVPPVSRVALRAM